MIVEVGPPGVKGVTTIMGLAGTESADPAVKVAWASGGVWLLGLLIGSNTLKNAGLGGIVASVAIRRM